MGKTFSSFHPPVPTPGKQCHDTRPRLDGDIFTSINAHMPHGMGEYVRVLTSRVQTGRRREFAFKRTPPVGWLHAVRIGFSPEMNLSQTLMHVKIIRPNTFGVIW